MGGKILMLQQPPNRQTVVIDNPGVSDGVHDGILEPDYRNSGEYFDLCRVLRSMLDETQSAQTAAEVDKR